MLQPGLKPKWWLPLLMFFTPGVCYLYASVFPSFRKDFAVAAIVLMTGNIILSIWRVISPERTDTHMFRSIAAHGFTLAGLLIACQFWIAFRPTAEVVIITVLLALYFAAWFFPMLFPSVAQILYREIWFPKSTIMQVLTRGILMIGGAAGAVGAVLGLRISRLGHNAWLVMAILSTSALVSGTFYISAQLWRHQQGLKPIPAEKE